MNVIEFLRLDYCPEVEIGKKHKTHRYWMN
jgi:hypothetical protein